MRRFRPRDAAFALPWLLAACASEPPLETTGPGPCQLLCVLERVLFGEPEPPPAVPVPPKAPRVHPKPKAEPQRIAHLEPPPKPLPPIKPAIETSVVARTPPTRPRVPTALAAPPSRPPAPLVRTAAQPPKPPRSLSQTIPGSVLIRPPGWQP